MRSLKATLITGTALAVLGGATALVGTGAASAQSDGELGTPPPEVVQAAIDFEPLIRYHRDLPGGAYTNTGNTGGHTYILAAAARAGDTSVDARILEQIRYTLTGGNDIAANGGYPAQHELQMTGLLSIVERIPRIWDQLTADEKARADAMMKASLVGSAFTTSDQNPFVLDGTQQYTMDADPNLNRSWNPNFREGMAGSVIVASAYLGVQDAKTFLREYDHEAFVSELESLGLSNSHETFNWKVDHPDSPAPTAEQIEGAVHNWSLWDVPIDDLMGLYTDLTAYTYGHPVSCGLENGQGIPADGAPDGVAGVIDSGCEELPNLGEPGMLYEFDAVDASGQRSSAGYTYGGFKPNLFTRTVLIDAGLWQPDSSN